MFIEEIILEGFKSYAQRTRISGFDRSFNAITGENGTGKSNILDAICFVLGITSLTQVRVGSLEELVSRNAGITKASVSIVFNNEDKSQSPLGYEHCNTIEVTRQVVIGGRNKFLINGTNAQQDRVQTLFHSVQLNVNNPHFLIMQGRIDRVVSMKPPEILAMLEEATGTRMYEKKKATALKTIEKKESKVESIQKMIDDEIKPTLQKLESEQKDYVHWSNGQREIEELTHFLTAYEYYEAKKMLASSSAEVSEMEANKSKHEEQQKQLQQELVQISSQLEKMKQEHEKKMTDKMKSLEEKAAKQGKQLVQINTEYENFKKSLVEKEHSVTKYQKNQTELKNSIKEKEKQLSKFNQDFASVEKSYQEVTDQLNTLQHKYEALSMGMTTNDDNTDPQTLADKIMEARGQVTSLEAEKEKAILKIPHLEKELEEKRKSSKNVGEEFLKLQNEKKNVEKKLEQLKNQLSELRFDEKREQFLLNRKRELETKIFHLRQSVENLSARLNMNFEYSDPEPNFDKSKVKGFVAECVQVKDSKFNTALEVTAGTKLRNVIVDTEKTGKSLLKNGHLTKRVTLIPLNNITHRILEDKKLKSAEEYGASLALSMIDYDKELKPAMEHIFGTTLITTSSQQGKQVTFDPNIKARSVTVQGDLFDPSGTLTGGSRPAVSVLELQQKLNATKKELKEHEEELEQVIQELQSLQKVAKQYKELKPQLDLQQHQVDLLRKKGGENKHQQLLDTISNLETDLNKQKEFMNTCQEKINAANEAVKKYEKEMKNMKGSRDFQLKDLEDQMNALKKKVSSTLKELKNKQKIKEEKNQEYVDLQNELETLGQEIQAIDLEKEEKVLEEMKSRVDSEREKYNVIQEELKKQKETILKSNNDIADLLESRDQLQSQKTNAEIEIKKLEGKIAGFHKKKKEASTLVKQFETKYSWIQTEGKFFGKPGTEYDFAAKDPTKCQKELALLQEKQAKLNKSVNRKVMSMYEKAKSEYEELLKKKEIVENDKAKIQALIAELDENKIRTLKQTWEKVNKDFGSIFSTLLPGSASKLEMVGQSILDGLEMRVSFGNVWKESLTELSGGQKSLLALSLILSLLLFKPAPMYLLDEIDAALDLQHTQNIGQMLKTHFSKSQFIIISLKPGMFQSANVVFTAEFVDGMSRVKRVDNRKQQSGKNKNPPSDLPQNDSNKKKQKVKN